MCIIGKWCKCGAALGGTIVRRGAADWLRVGCSECGRFYGYRPLTREERQRSREALALRRSRKRVEAVANSRAERERRPEETLTFRAFGVKPRTRR